MTHNQFALLKDRRFLPLFATQFLGAFHDNLFKNALVVLLVFSAAFQGGGDPKLLVTLAAGLFILPFVLFSCMGGQLADKFPKERVIRFTKLAEIAIALAGAAALLSGSTVFSFAVLFALGTQSAFFGPSKYSILPQHLESDELIGGNALLNTGTFLAILLGTIAGTTLVTLGVGKLLVAGLMIAIALAGYFASRFIPVAPPKAPDLKINYNPLSETLKILGYVLKRERGVVLAIFGVAWFYFLGGVFMAQLPNYINEALGANERVLAFFLVVFSVGIAIGGLFNNRLLKGRIEAVYVPFAALGITIFSVDLYFASAHVAPLPGADGPIGLAAFLSGFSAWRTVIDMTMIAICGGLFVVPLNAIIQHRTHDDHRARVLAGSAIMNALFIVASSVISGVLLAAGWEVRELFLAFAAANIFVALGAYKLSF